MKIKKISTSIAIILLFILIAIFINPRKEKILSGRVLDCQTNQPVEGVEIVAAQTGWGWDSSVSYLVWDKSYATKTITDNNGNYILKYNVGSSAHIVTTKDGYYKADQYESPGNNILIKVLSGNKDNKYEFTSYCKFLKDCMQMTVENGVKIYRDICNKYDN